MTEANAGWAHSTIVKEGGLWSVYAWSASLGGRGLQKSITFWSDQSDNPADSLGSDYMFIK